MIPEQMEGFNYIWVLDESTFTPPPKTGMVGVGGVRTFVLSVVKSGNEHLTFAYGKSWLYNQTISEYYKSGKFNASIMEGYAIQLGIEASE